MRQRVALENRDCVRHGIPTVDNHSSGSSTGVQCQHGLDLQVELRHVELLEHDLGDLLSVDLRVQGTLRLQHRVLVRGHS